VAVIYAALFQINIMTHWCLNPSTCTYGEGTYIGSQSNKLEVDILRGPPYWKIVPTLPCYCKYYNVDKKNCSHTPEL